MKLIIEYVVFLVMLTLIQSCKKEADNTIRDIDGNAYTSVTIITQVWMVENLRTTRYNNGDTIGTTNPATLDISPEVSSKYQWPYGGLEGSVAVYGRLYTWFAATDPRGICPVGWHVPGMQQWVALRYPYNIPSGTVIGSELMETGTGHWNRSDITGTNETGFSAVPGGYRLPEGLFSGVTQIGKYWSSDESAYKEYSIPYPIPITSDYLETPSHDLEFKSTGFSIRCIKNN